MKKLIILVVFLMSIVNVLATPMLSISKNQYYFNEHIMLQLDAVYENVTVYYMPRDFGMWLEYASYTNVSNISISLPVGEYAVKVNANGVDSNVIYVSVVYLTLYDIIYLVIYAAFIALALIRGPGWAALALIELIIISSWNAFGLYEAMYFWLFGIALVVGFYSFIKYLWGD